MDRAIYDRSIYIEHSTGWFPAVIYNQGTGGLVARAVAGAAVRIRNNRVGGSSGGSSGGGGVTRRVTTGRVG